MKISVDLYLPKTLADALHQHCEKQHETIRDVIEHLLWVNYLPYGYNEEEFDKECEEAWDEAERDGCL